MWEMATDRTRKAFALANQEAQRLNHEYVSTEHLLLGLIKEGTGVAYSVLEKRGITLDRATEAVATLSGRGPEIVTMVKLPETPRLKSAKNFMVSVAAANGSDRIGTEHALMGLMLEKGGAAVRVIESFGCTSEMIQKDVMQLIAPKEDGPKEQFQDAKIALANAAMKLHDAQGELHDAQREYDVAFRALDALVKGAR